jgi:hypothetical protein
MIESKKFQKVLEQLVDSSKALFLKGKEGTTQQLLQSEGPPVAIEAHASADSSKPFEEVLQLRVLLSFSTQCLVREGLSHWERAFNSLSVVGYAVDLIPSQKWSGGLFEGYSVAVRLKYSEGAWIFTGIVQSLLLHIAESEEEEQLQKLFSSLSDLKGFFEGNIESRPLSLEKQQGLWAELWLLDQLLHESWDEGKVDVVDSWLGPIRGAQDFKWLDSAIEVKACLGEKSLINVSSLEQLDSSELEHLYLSVIRLVLSDSDSDKGLTLYGIVEKVRESIGVEACARSAFEARLLMSGYKEEHALTNYAKVALEVKQTQEFLVSESFPCLSKTNTPSSLRRASYRMDVEDGSLESFAVNEKMNYYGELFHD